MNVTENTQFDVSSVTIIVTEQMRQNVLDKHLRDDEVAADGGTIAIPYGDDPNKADDPANEEYAWTGFLAEEALAEYLEREGVSYTHNGGEGSIDFTVNGSKNVEVKSRQSKTAFRNATVNEYPKSNIDYRDIDFYSFCVAHYNNRNEIVAVEILGFSSRSEVQKVNREQIEMHDGNDQHHKYEYPTYEMTEPAEFVLTATL